MKKNIQNILLLMLALVMALSFASCGTDDGAGNTDGGNDTAGDGTNTETPPADENADPENVVLIKNSTAQFRIVIAQDESDAAVRKSLESFISNLKDIGVEVEALVNDTDAASVTDCEIIVGTGVQNRDSKYVLNARDYGEDGYVIKVVDNKVLIGGGNASQTKTAFDYFVKNVVKLTSKTKEMSELKLERTYEKLKETKYLIDSVEIAGNDLSEYVFVTNVKTSANPTIKNFRENLYTATGYWLENVKPENVQEGQKVFYVNIVENAGDSGFRAYVDSSENFVVECAYSNAIDGAFEHLTKTYIFDKLGDVTFGKSFEKTYPVNVVYYAQFGAKGDGITNDAEAIYNAHVFANQCGQKVMGDGPDATYYIHELPASIPVTTNVDWNGSTFYVDDTGSEIYKQRGNALFFLTSTAKTTTYNKQQIAEMFPGVEIEQGATELPWLADYIDVVSYVTIKNDHKDYIRHGANTSAGYVRQDILVVNPDGTLAEDEVIWDFKESDQFIHNWAGTKFKKDSDGHPTWFGAKIVHTQALTSIQIVEANDEPITVENGIFNRKVCTVVPETNYENVYTAYARGITIRRCNSTVKNVRHCNLEEPEFHAISNTAGSLGSDMWKDYYGVDVTKGKDGYFTDEKGSRYFINQSYPYGGMLSFSNTYNSKAVDCQLTGRTVYYEAKTTSATPIAMGSYDLHIQGSSHVTIQNVHQLNDINDTQYWGIMNSNRAKNLKFIDSSLSRFDAHEGFWNGEFINTTFGRYINVIGGGHLLIDGCTRNVGRDFISLRGDYGSTFNGTIEIKNCTMNGLKEYRRTPPAEAYYDDSTMLQVINGAGSYSKNYNIPESAYVSGNAGSFPYLKWDFGYTCYMPQHLVIDNFMLNPNCSAKIYIYNNIIDEAFVKPDDFDFAKDYTYEYEVDGKKYIGIQQVLLPDGTYRDMTKFDVYYNRYVLTKSIIFRNMQPLEICSGTGSYMYQELNRIDTVE
jgi:hypothetical protein